MASETLGRFNPEESLQACTEAEEARTLTGGQFVSRMEDIHTLTAIRLRLDPYTAADIILIPNEPWRPTVRVSGYYDSGIGIAAVGLELWAEDHTDTFGFEPQGDRAVMAGRPSHYFSPILEETFTIEDKDMFTMGLTDRQYWVMFDFVFDMYSNSEAKYQPLTSKEAVLSHWDRIISEMDSGRVVAQPAHLHQAIQDMHISQNPKDWQEEDDTFLRGESEDLTIAMWELEGEGEPHETYVRLNGETIYHFVVTDEGLKVFTDEDRTAEITLDPPTLASVLRKTLEAFRQTPIIQD